jgi:hypothetical protein
LYANTIIARMKNPRNPKMNIVNKASPNFDLFYLYFRRELYFDVSEEGKKKGEKGENSLHVPQQACSERHQRHLCYQMMKKTVMMTHVLGYCFPLSFHLLYGPFYNNQPKRQLQKTSLTLLGKQPITNQRRFKIPVSHQWTCGEIVATTFIHHLHGRGSTNYYLR